jgi:hypothetical protein
MLGDGPLMFREAMMREQLPLATIHAAVIDFLRGRTDVVLFGAQAVNAYVDETRATQDVDVMSMRAVQLADEIRSHLNNQFHIAVRVREVRDGLGYRIYQLRKPTNRHLVDVRPVGEFPPTQVVDDVQVVTPAELIANKVVAWHHRQGKPKSGTDWRDIAVMVLAFPELKREDGPVMERLKASGADDAILARWRGIVAQDIQPEDDDAGF